MPTISVIPSTPFGDIKPHWREWIDALDTWLDSGEGIPARPCLYQPAGDLDAVRGRVGEYEGLKEGIVKAADDALNAEMPKVEQTPHPMLGMMSRATGLANAYILTGDDRYAAKAWEIAEFGMEWPEWIAVEHKPLTIDLRSAASIHAFAVILDRTDAWLSNDRRAKLTNYIVSEINRYVRICDAHAEWWTYSTHNWRTAIGGQYGIAALAVMDSLDADVLKRAATHSLIGSLVILDNGDIDGGWFEGVGYWRYGIGEAVQYLDVLQRLSGGAVDAFSHPYLTRTGDFGIHQTFPDGRVFNWADCGPKVNACQLLARLARAHQRSDWQAYVRRYPEPPNMETLYWEDRDLEAASYDEFPLVKHFRGSEVATLRTGWENDDLFLGVKAGESTANHSHLDIGSFMLRAHGEILVGEGDHWDYGTGEHFFDMENHRWDYPGLNPTCHSTLLVEGEGQAYGVEHNGTIVGSGDYGDWAFCTVDATNAYPRLNRFVRYFLLLRPDTVVVVDDVASDDLVRLGWRAIVPHSVERTGWPEWVSRAESGATLAVKWLAPFDDDGIITEINQLDAHYQGRGGLATPSCRMLTISPMIRQRAVQLAAAMRVSKGDVVMPEVSIEPAYRSVRVVGKTAGTQGTWSIMLGEPGIQKFS